MRISRPLVQVLTALWAVALVATACGGSASVDEVSNEAPDSEPAEPPTEAPEPEPTLLPETEEAEPSETEEAPSETEEAEPSETEEAPSETEEAGAPDVAFWSDVLVVGDCFNRSDLTGDFGETPTPLSCDDLHEEEIYAIGRLDDGPTAPYPGVDATADRTWDELCDAATQEFAGRPFDELPFDVYTLFPLESEWEAGDRGIMCSAASNVEGRLKLGSAAAGTLNPEAQLVARVSLSTPDFGEFEDWVIIDRNTLEEDAISLTDGGFDLRLRRPSASAEGIVFDATRVGDQGFATTISTIDLTTGDLGEIPVPVEGFEYSSTIGYSNSLVFAARETDEADWNLFAVTGDGSATAIGDTDADEHFPALSTDGETVVFQREGDLWRSNIDGANQVQLTDTDANEWESEISPDGQSIVFVSDRGGSDDLWLMTIDGDNVEQLTDHPADEIWPTWSGDGSTIFFASDRFSPEGNHASIMALQPGDAAPSYFSTFANIGHPLVVDSSLAANAASVFPTLGDRYFGAEPDPETIAGTPGTLATWEHSSGRLGMDIPVGWTVAEGTSSAIASVIAAPDIDAYFETWAIDAVLVGLYEAPDFDTFTADIFSEAAVFFDADCTEVDNTGGPQTEGTLTAFGQIFACSDANASVLGLYDESTGLGVLIEGQRDNLPDTASDEELLNAIAASVRWS